MKNILRLIEMNLMNNLKALSIYLKTTTKEDLRECKILAVNKKLLLKSKMIL